MILLTQKTQAKTHTIDPNNTRKQDFYINQTQDLLTMQT